MTPEEQVYPQSDTGGLPIPYDIGSLKGLWITPITDAPSASQVLPAGWSIVVLFATIACVIGFDDSAELTEGTELVSSQLVPANTPVSIRLKDGQHTFKVIGITAAATGKLYLQAYDPWKALKQQPLATKL